MTRAHLSRLRYSLRKNLAHLNRLRYSLRKNLAHLNRLRYSLRKNPAHLSTFVVVFCNHKSTQVSRIVEE